MDEAFTDVKEFISKQVLLTAGTWRAHPIVCPLRVGGKGRATPLCGKKWFHANSSGSRVFASPGNNYRNTQSLKGNIWLEGGKLANTQSKQGVTLCRRKEIAGENVQGLCPRHIAPCPGLTFLLELCTAPAFPTDGCTAQSPVTCLSPSEAPMGERGPPTVAAGTQSQIMFAAQVAPGPGLCGQPGLLVCLQCNWRCWFRPLEIPSPSARSQGVLVLGALPHLQGKWLIAVLPSPCRVWRSPALGLLRHQGKSLFPLQFCIYQLVTRTEQHLQGFRNVEGFFSFWIACESFYFLLQYHWYTISWWFQMYNTVVQQLPILLNPCPL